jgi:hypothetical protein
MISTLEGLRRRYGYVDDDIEEGGSSRSRFDSDFDRTVPRYFDIIGFNESWRKRFRNVFIIKKKNKTKTTGDDNNNSNNNNSNNNIRRRRRSRL